MLGGYGGDSGYYWRLCKMINILFGIAFIYIGILSLVIVGGILKLLDPILAGYIWFGGMALGASVAAIIAGIRILLNKDDF